MEIAAAIVVAAISALSGGFAIPIGFALGLSPLTVYLAATIGSLSGLIVFLFAGGKVRSRFSKSPDPDEGADLDTDEAERRTDSRSHRLVERYGAKGLGMVGPIFPGVTGSVIIGLGMGLERKAIARWMSLGIAVMFAIYVAGLWSLIEIVGVE